MLIWIQGQGLANYSSQAANFMYKVLWKHTMPICFSLVCGCFCTATAEVTNCNRAHVACTLKYWLSTSLRKSLSISELGHQKQRGFHLLLITCSWGNQLPCHEGTQTCPRKAHVTRNQGLLQRAREGQGFLQLAMWGNRLETVPQAPLKASDDCTLINSLTASSWGTPSLNHPPKLLSDSRFSEIMWDTKCLFVVVSCLVWSNLFWCKILLISSYSPPADLSAAGQLFCLSDLKHRPLLF